MIFIVQEDMADEGTDVAKRRERQQGDREYEEQEEEERELAHNLEHQQEEEVGHLGENICLTRMRWPDWPNFISVTYVDLDPHYGSPPGSVSV